jgi:hypothetical protein
VIGRLGCLAERLRHASEHRSSRARSPIPRAVPAARPGWCSAVGS